MGCNLARIPSFPIQQVYQLLSNPSTSLNMTFKLILVVVVALSLSVVAAEDEVKVVNVELLDLCVPGAAPVGGTWQVIEKNVKKVCPPGSSCRTQACNCDDLADGTIMSHSPDKDGNQVCRRIAGQKCSSDDQCVSTAKCTEGICTCPDKSDCVDKKRDAQILFR